jgi:hypothetical protein
MDHDKRGYRSAVGRRIRKRPGSKGSPGALDVLVGSAYQRL